MAFNGYRVGLNIHSVLKVGTRIKYTTVSSCNTEQSTNKKREKWDLMSAVSLERKPVIARNLNALEEKMFNLLNKIEVEKSSKSDHEIRIITDKIKLEQLKKGNSKIDLDNIPEQSAQDFEDASLKELNTFKFATQKDCKEDVKAIERHLDRNLLLLFKENIGKKSYWVLPQGLRRDGETLRQTAERILVEKCGPQLKVDFFGNAPVGIYKYKYPKKLQQNDDSSIGAKIFFFKAQLRDGNIESASKSVDYKWATRTELNILNKDYYKSVSMFLIDEEH